MPGTCELCGEQVVEREAAHGSAYVGACASCRAGYDSPPAHVETCERAACVVCQDHREEFGR